jgi:hypothetical protein
MLTVTGDAVTVAVTVLAPLWRRCASRRSTDGSSEPTSAPEIVVGAAFDAPDPQAVSSNAPPLAINISRLDHTRTSVTLRNVGLGLGRHGPP